MEINETVKGKPLVSVIVPVYNIEKYIGKCLESICNQTYNDLEIIVVDDGATDESGKICDKYKEKDDRITVIHKENGGLSSARNAGLKVAKGEFIYFVDGDDLINEACINRLLAIQNQDDYDIVQCKTFAFLDEKLLPPKMPSEPLIDEFCGKDFCKMMLFGSLGSDGGVVWNKLYKRDFFDDILFPEGLLHEDDATVFKLYWRAKKVAKTDERLSYYRSKRSGSIMHTEKKHYWDQLRAKEIQYEFFKDKKEPELLGQILYTTGNMYALMRKDKEFYELEKSEKNKIKKRHKKIMLDVVKSKISMSKKMISFIGCEIPGVVVKMKGLKRRLISIHNR